MINQHEFGVLDLSGSLLAGLVLGTFIAPPPLLCAALCFAFACLAAVCFHRSRGFSLNRRERRLFRLFLCLAVLCAGVTRVRLSGTRTPAANALERRVGEFVSFEGFVCAPPMRTASRTSLRVRIDDGQTAGGKVLLAFYADPGMTFEYGDRLAVSGTLTLPADPGSGFSFRDYLEKDGIAAMINNPRVEKLPEAAGLPFLRKLYRLRNVLIERVGELFPKPENALMTGILLGDETGIPSDVERAFERTGTSHIIAISGENFTLLAWLLTSLLRRFMTRRRAVLPVLFFIPLYAALVGGSAAVVRAAVMCALTLLGTAVGRKGNGVASLVCTAALMCLFRPAFITDVGFQLSACATLGILLFSDPLRKFSDKRLARTFPAMSEGTRGTLVEILSDLCLLSVCAQVFTVWISAKSFGQISLISLPANMLIAPFQPLIMLGGFLSLLLSFIFRPLGSLAAKLIWPAPALTIRLVERCSEFDWASIYVELPEAAAWLICGAVVLLWHCRRQLADYSPRRNIRSYAAAVLLFVCLMVWIHALERRDTDLRISFAATDGKMSLKLRTPANRSLLLADGQTNYSARDLLDRRLFTAAEKPCAAVIDFRSPWMRDLFRDSREASSIELLIAGGTDADGVPFEAGDSFEADGVLVTCVSVWLGRRAWTLESRERVLLFPNGIPPERVYSRAGLYPESVSLVLLGAKDDPAQWPDSALTLRNRAEIRIDEKGEIRLTE